GYRVLEPTALLANHLNEIVWNHADELLTRDALRQLLDELKKSAPAAVEELVPGLLKLGELQQVLHLLLREQVPVRQLATILEALSEVAGLSKDPVHLAERVRVRLARTLSSRYRDESGVMRVATLSPELEAEVLDARSLDKDAICQAIAEVTDPLVRSGGQRVLLVAPRVRVAMRHLTATRLPRLAVLSYDEITRDTRV